MEKTYAEIFSRNRIAWFYEIARSGVSPAAVKVGLLVATFVNPERREEVSPSYAWIAETAKLSRPTIGRCIEELVRAGFLDVVKYPGHRISFSLPFSGDAEWLKPVPKMASEIEGV
jgi:hypothetical protein